jgi:hypothetical protein
MRTYFRFGLLIFILLSFVNSYSLVGATLEGSNFYGPIQIQSEPWTLIWETSAHEESKCGEVDPISGDVIWGCISKPSNIEFRGVIHRVSSTGVVKWSTQITQHDNPIPLGIVINSTADRIYVAISATESGISFNLLYLLEYRLSSGIYLNSTLISRRYGNGFTMAPLNSGNLGLFYQVLSTLDQQDVNATLFNPITRRIITLPSIPNGGNVLNSPQKLVVRNKSSEIFLVVLSFLKEDDVCSVRILAYNTEDSNLVFSRERYIVISPYKYKVVGLSYFNYKLYLATQYSNILQYNTLDLNLNTELDQKYTYDNIEWTGFQVLSANKGYLIGHGFNDLNGSTFAATQSYLFKFYSLHDPLSLTSSIIYGNASSPDLFTGLILAPSQGVFIFGHGSSYGPENRNDYNAYLMNFENFPKTTSSTKSENQIISVNQQRWMWGGIIGFTVIFIVVNLKNRKKH